MSTTSHSIITHDFAEAHTGLGFRTFYPLLLRSVRTVFVLHNGQSESIAAVFRSLMNKFQDQPIRAWHHAIDPEHITGLLFTDSRVAVVTAHVYQQIRHNPPCEDIQHLDLREFPDNVTTPNGISRAHRLLTNARHYRMEHTAALLEWGAIDFVQWNQWRLALSAEYLNRYQRKVGQDTHVFGTVLTAQGPQRYVAEISSATGHRVLLRGPSLEPKTSLIRWLGEKALMLGFDVIFYHCGLDPARIDHIFMPELDMGFFNATAPHDLEARPHDRILHTEGAINRAIADNHKDYSNLIQQQYQNAYTMAWRILGDLPAVKKGLRSHPPRHVMERIATALREGIQSAV